MRAGADGGGGGLVGGRAAGSGSPPPPLGPPGPLSGPAPPGGGLPPPRPPGLLHPREVPDRSRAVRFDPALHKIRSRSSDDALLHHRLFHDDEADGPEQAVGGKPHHNIHVAVRCRGLLTQEHKEGGRAIVNVQVSKIVILEDPHTTAADDYLRINKSKERRYAFDEAFGEDASQQQVYERTTKVLIGGVLEGFNATVFAYGATSAGKTYTMLGNPTEPGIMMRTLHDLFSEVAVQREDKVFEVKCSFLEVYNENIRDLLRPDSDYLDIREDPVKGMCVAGISEVGGLESANEIMLLLHQANRHRTTEATGANVTSSRSHAVLQVVVEQRERTAGMVAQVNVGKLSMIDLAGSERASQTNNKGMRMIEGANINRSLLALGNCITALSSGVAFVPYRDSKMTRLLKDSLGGNCRTVMIANVSPCHLNYEDTHNTLKYASRAKNIKTKAMKNVVSVNYHVSKYTEIIKELKGEIAELKTKLSEEVPTGALLGHGLDAAAFRSGGTVEEEDAMIGDELKTAKQKLKLNGGLPAGALLGREGGARIEEGAVAGDELESAHVQSTNWKQELMANFEERVRIKRQLIDLAHVAQNQMVQKSKAQVGISQWESTQVPSQASARHLGTSPSSDGGDASCSASSAEATPQTVAEMPQGIRELQEQLQLIRTQMVETEETTRDLENQLVENLKVSERLQVELPTRVPNKDMRAFLGLVYRIYVLEVENIDLQEMNDVTQPLLQQKELEAEALRLQIRMRDKMIEEQDRLLALECEEIPLKPAGWEAIPAKSTRRPLKPISPGDDDNATFRQAGSVDPGRVAREGRLRARSAGPERLGGREFVLPPLSPLGRERLASHDLPVLQQPPAAVSSSTPPPAHGGVSPTDAMELPPLDISGRGLGAQRPVDDPFAKSPNGNDLTRPLPAGAGPPVPPSHQHDAPSSAPGIPRTRQPSDLPVVEGHPAMPLDRRPPPNSTAGQQESRNRMGANGAAGGRRGRKKRRERDAASHAAYRERLQHEKAQLQVEAAGLQRERGDYGRGMERDDVLSHSQGSSSERTPPRQRNSKEAAPIDAPAFKEHHSNGSRHASRKGVIEKLNRRLKVAPPKSLS